MNAKILFWRIIFLIISIILATILMNILRNGYRNDDFIMILGISLFFYMIIELIARKSFLWKFYEGFASAVNKDYSSNNPSDYSIFGNWLSKDIPVKKIDILPDGTKLFISEDWGETIVVTSKGDSYTKYEKMSSFKPENLKNYTKIFSKTAYEVKRNSGATTTPVTVPTSSATPKAIATPVAAPAKTLGTITNDGTVLQYNGYEYRTLMDGVKVNGTGTVTQKNPIKIPAGYELVPDSPDVRQNVMGAYNWTSTGLVFNSKNGAIITNQFPNDRGKFAYTNLEILNYDPKNNTASPRYEGFQILIRKPIGSKTAPAPVTAPIAAPVAAPTKKIVPANKSCYGASDDICETCDDVVNAYKKKNWAYNKKDFIQCQSQLQTQVVFENPSDYVIYGPYINKGIGSIQVQEIRKLPNGESIFLVEQDGYVKIAKQNGEGYYLTGKIKDLDINKLNQYSKVPNNAYMIKKGKGTISPKTSQKAASIASPITAPIAAPVARPVAAPVASQLARPVAAPVASPLARSVAGPVARQVAGPVAASVASQLAGPVAAPFVSPMAGEVSALNGEVFRKVKKLGGKAARTDYASKALIRPDISKISMDESLLDEDTETEDGNISEMRERTEDIEEGDSYMGDSYGENEELGESDMGDYYGENEEWEESDEGEDEEYY